MTISVLPGRLMKLTDQCLLETYMDSLYTTITKSLQQSLSYMNWNCVLYLAIIIVIIMVKIKRLLEDVPKLVIY